MRATLRTTAAIAFAWHVARSTDVVGDGLPTLKFGRDGQQCRETAHGSRNRRFATVLHEVADDRGSGRVGTAMIPMRVDSKRWQACYRTAASACCGGNPAAAVPR